MNQELRRRLRPVLRALAEREKALRAEVAHEIAQLREEHGSHGVDPAGDSVDHAENRVRVSLENRLIDLHLDEMRALAAARDRITSGTFGVCLDCAEPIDLRRMAIVPTASRCAACQAWHERRSPGVH